MNAIDWIVVALTCVVVVGVGLGFSRRSSRAGTEGFFAGGRDLPWWAIGLSNTATYSSGTGAFVMLVLVFGLAGNWLWWASWVVWMPLVAFIWARLWRRMRIVTTAELFSLRYSGAPATVARRLYALVCAFGFAVLIISYITGFFVKTLAPLCSLEPWQVLAIFGGITVLYSMFGGLLGVVYADVVQFVIMSVGGAVFLAFAVVQHGGWTRILARVQEIRPEGLAQLPPTGAVEAATVFVLFLQGWFFSSSPTAGEGMTAQRFMAARSEAHAVGGQLFNAFLALSFRTLPLIGLGIVAMSIFWTSELKSPAPEGMAMLTDPAHVWGELIKRCALPLGLAGLLVAAEVAAYMSTLSSLINWGGSFVVNDLLPARISRSGSAWIARLTTLVLFLFAATVTVLFVDDMVSWFLFINSAMVSFLLPLSWLRFLWWRFNVWGELAAIVLGLPLSVLVWFVLDFQHRPLWQGVGLLFGLSIVLLVGVTLATPAEPRETLRSFYRRCRPPGLWREFASELGPTPGEPPARAMFLDSLLGILLCVALVVATNAVLVADWPRVALCTVAGAALAGWLGSRMRAQHVSKT
jgi:solute:Na+ symporter, SSS family